MVQGVWRGDGESPGLNNERRGEEEKGSGGEVRGKIWI